MNPVAIINLLRILSITVPGVIAMKQYSDTKKKEYDTEDNKTELAKSIVEAKERNNEKIPVVKELFQENSNKLLVGILIGTTLAVSSAFIVNQYITKKHN